MLNPLLWLLRVFAYCFHLALALFLTGLSIVAISTGKALALGMLPWEGAPLTRWTLALGLLGIICVVLAVIGVARWLFPFWTLFALIMIVRGYFLSSYSFSGDFKFAVWLAVGALVAFLASLSLFRPRKRA